MPAISSNALVARADMALHQLAKRSNWPAENAGVMVVFVIVFIVAVGLLALFIYKKLVARKAAKAQY